MAQLSSKPSPPKSLKISSSLERDGEDAEGGQLLTYEAGAAIALTCSPMVPYWVWGQVLGELRLITDVQEITKFQLDWKAEDGVISLQYCPALQVLFTYAHDGLLVHAQLSAYITNLVNHFDDMAAKREIARGQRKHRRSKRQR